MKKFIVSLLIFSTIFSLFLLLMRFSVAKSNEGGRKIVVFRSNVYDTQKDEIIRLAGGSKLKNLNLVRGSVVYLPSKSEVEKLKANPAVLRVDDDVIVEALEIDDFDSSSVVNSLGKNSKPPQVLPWGIDRVDAELVWPTGNTGDSIKVGIIDTGISKKHPDLLANIKGGVNTIDPYKSWNDDNGHGSHVAGIVAALNNSIGVVGVGPKIDLYAIKVLNAKGIGYLSDLIEGIEWAIQNRMQVINMSLGTLVNIPSFRDAIIAAKNAGIVIVAAAGDTGGAVIYPAAYPEVIAVSAIDQNNQINPWSSRGPEVDLAAPGVSIYSTYKGKGYATLSGSSMAAPHVTGVAALVLNTPVGSYDLNGNGKWDPDEVQKKLQDTAVDLGAPGFDNLYGWGLVNAFRAVQK